MTIKTLKYTARTTKEGYRQLDKALLQFGVLYNALITHRRSRTSTHRHVKYLNIQNSHITDLHRNDPTYSGFARRLLASTAKRVNTAFARPHMVPGAGYPDTKDPHRFNTLEVSEPGTNHLKNQRGREDRHPIGQGTPNRLVQHRPPHEADPPQGPGPEPRGRPRRRHTQGRPAKGRSGSPGPRDGSPSPWCSRPNTGVCPNQKRTPSA